MFRFFSCFLIAFSLVACMSDSNDTTATSDAETAKQLAITNTETTTDQPITPESAQPVAAMLINMTFDAENFTVKEGLQTSIYGLEWQLAVAEDTNLSISEIVLKEALPFDFSMELTDPLEPCGDQVAVKFSYTANGNATELTSSEPFIFYDCATCIQGLKLQYKEGTYSDQEIINELFPSLVFKLGTTEDKVVIPDMVRLEPIHFYGDAFIEGVTSLTHFMQYGLFTSYDKETESGQFLMEFEFDVDWQRVEQGKVEFREVQANIDGEREVLTKMNWTWEIKGSKVALFDQNGDRYDVIFTSKIFKEDDTQTPRIQFKWKGKTFTSEPLSPC
ncbi:MAG: hypothetical protein R3E32_14240 [Chitinophagales bacterium]